MTGREVQIAIVQQPPVLLKRDETLARGGELIAEAARHGARLVSFPGTWVPAGRRTLDVAGHHGRPDVFRLEVRAEPRPPIVVTPPA